MNVLIADDEQIVLNGLKQIIDWEALGFTICAEATNGEEALTAIETFNPDLVLLDIRMPKMSGIEVVQAVSNTSFQGKFIILSGVSDFKLAQTAMRYGVDYYLTKPIDEEELEQAVISVRDSLIANAKNQSSYKHYREKAKTRILEDILLNQCDYHHIDLIDLHLSANVYQVISYENYHQQFFHPVWDFSDLMRVSNQDNRTFDVLDLNQQKIILLKGDFSIAKFDSMRSHYSIGPQKGSPLDAIFLSYGRKVARIEDIYLSYQDVLALSKRRFFCEENQHIVGYDQLPDSTCFIHEIAEETAPYFAERLTNYIQSYNHTLIIDTLKELTNQLFYTKADVIPIKHFLTDIYILVKQKISQIYHSVDIPFPSNASVIDLIAGKFYLYEIITFLAEQFELWMHAVGYSSGENVLEEVLHYIQHNYQENLKLESIAPLFGYNSSYLGKIFSKKVGMNFNAYVDHIRIDESKRLLQNEHLKVYEIAEQVGYNNVDYFHKKFKKYMNISPIEYRKNLGTS